MNKLKNIMLIFGVAIGIGLFAPVSANAANSTLVNECVGVTQSAVCNKANSTAATPSNFIGKIVSTLLFIIGALSVLMIIVGGLLYVTSNGDSGRVTMAKNTITYAIVGVVVSFLAFAIVQYVVSKFAP